MLSERFKTMYRQLGLDRTEAAKFLRVSERTLHNWESGKHEIPYSAYKLLRLQTYQELPGTAWRGWSFSAGCLWSPEGHVFKPADSAWWSLLCRRSANFGKLYDENRSLQQTLRNASKVVLASPSEFVQQHRQEVAPDASLLDTHAPQETGLQGVKELVTLHFSANSGTKRCKTARKVTRPATRNFCVKPGQKRGCQMSKTPAQILVDSSEAVRRFTTPKKPKTKPALHALHQAIYRERRKQGLQPLPKPWDSV